MKHRSILILAVLCGTALAGPHIAAVQAQARRLATVDDLVTRALVDSPDLHAARTEIEAAQGRLQQAGLRPNPMLDLGVQQNIRGPDNNFTVSATLPLDLNGRKAGRVGVATRELGMKRAQVVERERQLRAAVRLKAGELLAAQRSLDVTTTLVQVNRDALRLLRARVERGAAPPLEESLLRVEVHRLEISRTLLESRVEVITVQLKALIGASPETPVTLQDELRLPPLPFDVQEGVRRALATRPDLLVARAEVAIAEASISKEQAEGRWDASVNLGYMRQVSGYDLRGITERGGTQPIQDTFHYVGGGVTLTLPVRNQNQGNIAAAMATATVTRQRLDGVVLVVHQEVTAAFTSYSATRQVLEIYTRDVRDVARQNLDVVRQSYALGRTSLLDVIAEQRRYIDVETAYTETLKQAYDAVVEVERAVGALAH